MLHDNNPLNPIREEQDLQARRLLDARAANARSADEWFDVFEEMVRLGVMSTSKAHGDEKKGMEGFLETKPYLDTVRRMVVSHGLTMAEDIEIEGPVPVLGANNVMVGVEWPAGQYIKLFFQDKSVLEFRGRHALAAYAFFAWFGTFRETYDLLTGVPENQERRVIAPGSSEWNSYMQGRPG